MSLTDILNSLIGLFLNNSYWKQQQLILRRSLCTGFNSTLLHSSDTCEDLTQSGEVEESSLGHGEQLAQEHQKGDRGENHGEDHQDLHRLQPLWEKKKTSLNSGVTCILWRLFFWFCFVLPVSLEDAHSHVPVKLSNLQLYHRSEFFRLPHSHQDWNGKRGTTFKRVQPTRLSRSTSDVKPDHYLLHGGYEQHGQGDQMQQDHRHQQVCHFLIPCKQKQNETWRFWGGGKKVDFIVSALSQNTNLKIGMTERSVLCAGCTQTHFFFSCYFFRQECVDQHTTTLQKS